MELGTPLDVIVRPDAVNDYLERHGLELGNVPLEAVLVQKEGTDGGRPAVLFVVNVDGKRVVAKTTLRLLNAALRAINGVHGDDR